MKQNSIVLMGSEDCSVCLASNAHIDGIGNCRECGARPRTRSIDTLFSWLRSEGLVSYSSDPVLGFALTKREKTPLSKYFSHFESASLFGSYVEPHHTSTDARTMPHLLSNKYSLHFSSLLFDYFVEHDLALREALRVLRPGGLFATHIASGRVVHDESPPVVVGSIKKEGGRFQYVDSEDQLPSVKVGCLWFYKALARAGMERPMHIKIFENGSTMSMDWFVGLKPAAGL